MNLAIIQVGSAKLDARYISKIEEIWQKNHHVQLVSSKVFAIDGVPAYEAVRRFGKAPFASLSVELQTIADGKLYGLRSVVYGGDATQDSEMREALASFHFLHAPNPPGSFSFGKFGSLGLMVAALGAVIVGGIFVIRSRKT